MTRSSRSRSRLPPPGRRPELGDHAAAAGVEVGDQVHAGRALFARSGVRLPACERAARTRARTGGGDYAWRAMPRASPPRLPTSTPSAVAGLGTVVVVGLTTLLVYPLKSVAPVVSLGIVYLGVLVVSSVWGAWLGLRRGGQRRGLQLLPPPLRGLHHPRRRELGGAHRSAWSPSGRAISPRRRAPGPPRRASGGGGLAAEMARLLLRSGELGQTLPMAAQRLAVARTSHPRPSSRAGGRRRASARLRAARGRQPDRHPSRARRPA